MNKTIDRDRLTQFGNLELLAKQVVEGFITGLHKSPFHGFSVEFAEHRLYNQGESTKHIDWKLYARSGKLFTKKYEEETNLRCQFVLDCSPSMLYPPDKKENKLGFSVYAIASLIELFKRQRDAVGISLYKDKLNLHTPAKSSSAHHSYLYTELEKVLKNFDESSNKSSKTDTVQAIHDIAELSHKRSLIIIFSDLLDNTDRQEDFFNALQHLKHNKHEVILFHVLDEKLEQNFDFENRPYHFIDIETRESIKMHPKEFQAVYQKQMQNFMRSIELKCADYHIDFYTADINKGYNDVLLKCLLKRSKMW